MSAQIVVPLADLELPKSRLKALLDHLGEIEDPRDPWRVAYRLDEILFLVVCGTICDCDDYDTIADWGEERLGFFAALPALPSRHSRRALADHHDEPDRSGALPGRVHRLGARDLAGASRSRRHRRQDLAAQPRPQDRPGAAPSRLGFRHHAPARARPGGGRREVRRGRGHPGPGRAPRRRRRPRGGPRHHRRGGDQPDRRAGDPRCEGRLPARGQGQPAHPARRDRALSSRAPPRGSSTSIATSTRATAVSEQRDVTGRPTTSPGSPATAASPASSGCPRSPA